jgi:hypothetical protein
MWRTSLAAVAWEDRNKAGMLLAALSERRDAALLDALRQQALDSVIEMARWQERSHANPYRVLLGRIGGIDEPRLQRLVMEGRLDEIVASALASRE